MFEEALFSFLVADTDLTALVGQRIYPLLLPQQPTTPAISYQRISTTPLYALNGNQQLTKVRIQFDIFGATLADAKSVAEALHSRLDAYRGLMGSVQVGSVFRASEMDLYDPSVESFRVSTDYLIVFEGV